MEGGVMTTGLRQIVLGGQPLRMLQSKFHRTICSQGAIVWRMPTLAKRQGLAAEMIGLFGAASPPTGR